MTTHNDNMTDEMVLPPGFQAAGVAAGVKKAGGMDMALIVSDSPATVAGVFTTNRVSAAPVKLCRERLASGTAQAVVINSGNANACTGEGGLEDARETAAALAAALEINAEEVLVCSTGHIGVRLPMDAIRSGVQALAKARSPQGGEDAAHAILTTDTCPKRHTMQLEVDGQSITLAGMVKGAGMIEPNMATMLAFILTDAAVEQAALQGCLADAVDASFNRITVDGDMSTNDTVLLMANGVAGNTPLNESHADWPAFETAVRNLTLQLARDVVLDGEGANKLITLSVTGAVNDEQADGAARAIANSFLVKTSWTGSFPHWGRIMDVLGYCGAEVDENTVDISFDDLPATRAGLATDTPLDALKSVVAQEAFTIHINLHLGSGSAEILTCECSEEYVRVNM